MDRATKRYERLKMEYKIKDYQLRKKISEDDTLSIEDFINWRVVGPVLPEIDNQEISDIDFDVRGGENLKRRELLERFHQRNGNGATYEVLIKAMLSRRLEEDATSVFELLTGPPPPIPHDALQPLGPPGGETLADSPGLAILVTCDYINTAEKLLGTNVDASEMLKTFKFLNYVVHQRRNDGEEGCKAATKANVLELLASVSDYLKTYDERKTDNKVIIFAFSGHGRRDKDDKKMKIKVNDGELDVEDQIILPLTTHKNVAKIPKLFFLDACRGTSELKNNGEGDASLVPKGEHELVLMAKGLVTSSGNFRIDYATIPDHISYADDRQGSLWMTRMACALRERNDTVQNIAADVRKAVIDLLNETEEDTTQCGETQGRLFGALKLVQ